MLSIAMILFFLISLSGCEELTGTVQSGPEDAAIEEEAVEDDLPVEDENQDNTDSDAAPDEADTDDQAGDIETAEAQDEDTDPAEEAPDNVAIRVYFADETGEYLVGESRTIPYEHRYSNALAELMKLPVDEKLIPLIPESATINSLNIKNGIANIDFSQEFVDDRFTSDTADILLIYSIVNTLTEFPDINAVVFFIDGKRLDLLGMLDLSEPVFRKDDLILN